MGEGKAGSFSPRIRRLLAAADSGYMLGGFGQAEGGMQKEWGRNLQQIDSPRFASYATLQRGKGYEREYAEWCGWLADLLEKGADQIKRSRLS